MHIYEGGGGAHWGLDLPALVSEVALHYSPPPKVLFNRRMLRTPIHYATNKMIFPLQMPFLKPVEWLIAQLVLNYCC